MNLPELRQIAERAAKAAATVLLERPQEVREKRPADLVTECDLAAEEAIRGVLTECTPGIEVLAEEGGGAEHATTRWVVDPIDGTTNFVHGFPWYAVSIGLELDGAQVVGVVNHVPAGKVYSAAQGFGATCNGQPIAVSTTPTLSAALLGTGFPWDRAERGQEYLRLVERALVQTHGVRRAGAASLDLAMVAAGKLDGYWEFRLSPWDVAAGNVLVREAGGVAELMPETDPHLPSPLASNGHIHAALKAMLTVS